MDRPKHYVYLHRKADTGEVFYVGKGRGRRANLLANRNRYWKRIAEKHGRTVEIVAYFYEESDALAYEVELIASYRAAGNCLVNVTEGGEGASGRRHTEETKLLLSELAKVRPPQSKDARDRQRAAMIGRQMTEEHRRKLSEANRRRFADDPAERERFSMSRKGAIVSEETREKISLAHTGRRTGRTRVFSEETLEKMRASQARRWSRPEEHAKMSAAQRNRGAVSK